jgi:hypothetical protein
MFAIEDLLENYVTPDGVTMTGMPMGLIGPPDDDFTSGFEWGGEWTVTYETFRDMGGAFVAAMLLIYGLIVWEVKNVTLGGLIMAPIPLTLIGIVPGHWLSNAEFTATSMIGFIALAGIVVRNSILLVEFVKHEIADGKPIEEAVVAAGQARMRPILITALTLMAGAYMILDDLIFKGMAVSLLYGAGVATVLTLVVIPLGCISVSKQFYRIANVGSCPVTGDGQSEVVEPAPVYQLPLWLRIWMSVVSAVTWVYYIARMFVIMVRMGIQSLLERFGGGSEPDLPGGSAPPGGAPSGGSPSPAPMPTPSGDGVAVATETMQEAESVAEESTIVESKENTDSETTQKPVAKKTVTKKAVAKKKAAPKKRAAPKKKVVKKEIASDSEKTVSASKKKSSAPKKRRGIRLNPGLDNE